MLRELQRVKSEGDFENLVENYGTQVDAEVLERYAALDEAAYNRFVNPVLTPVMQDGKIADITVAPRNLLWSRCSTTLTIIRSCLPRTRAPLRHDRDLNFTISSWFNTWRRFELNFDMWEAAGWRTTHRVREQSGKGVQWWQSCFRGSSSCS